MTNQQSQSSSDSPSELRHYWLGHARVVARWFNLAWFFDRFAVPLVVGSIFSTALILAARRETWFQTPWTPVLLALGLLLILSILAWFKARSHFIGKSEALTHLDTHNHLNNSLTIAYENPDAAWAQKPTDKVSHGLIPRWRPLFVPLLGSFLLILAAFLIPVTPPDLSNKSPEQPRSWGQLEKSLATLDSENASDQDDLEKVRDQLAELRTTNPQNWFDHSQLEASDHLIETHRKNIRNLARNLNQARQALAQLNEASSPAQKKQAQEKLQQALTELQNGGLKPNQALMEQLSSEGAAQLSQLTPEQMEQIQEAIEKNNQALQKANQQAGGNPSDDWTDELLAGQEEGGGG